MARLYTPLVLATVLLFATFASAALRVYQDCAPSQRSYIADCLEDAIANIELVVQAGKNPNGKLEMKYLGVLNQMQKDMVTATYAHALHNRPTLLFTCPKRGSEVENLCLDSPGRNVSETSIQSRIGISLTETEDNGLLACSAPQVGVNLAFANKIAIVTAIIRMTLEEEKQQKQ